LLTYLLTTRSASEVTYIALGGALNYYYHPIAMEDSRIKLVFVFL